MRISILSWETSAVITMDLYEKVDTPCFKLNRSTGEMTH